MTSEHSTHYFLHSVPGFEHIPEHVLHSGLVFFILIVSMGIARQSLYSATQKDPQGVLIPEAKWTYRNFFEVISEKLFDLTKSVLGDHDAPKYFPFIGTVFCYILLSNLIGLVPGFSAPTDNLNTTLALGLFVFIYYNAIGIRENGLGAHLKHFLGPNLFLAPLILIIELISHAVRPVSLAMRLKWNLTADHIVLHAFSNMAPPYTELFVPIVFMGFGLFVAFVQAFVFSLMTMVYISMSTAHDH